MIACTPPLVGGSAVARAGLHHAVIVDQGIDAAEAVADLLDEGACVVVLAHVGDDRDRPGTDVPDLLGERLHAPADIG